MRKSKILTAVLLACSVFSLSSCAKKHTHTLGDWTNNETFHWKACTGCGEKVEVHNHIWGEVVVIEPATFERTGTGKKECLICHYSTYVGITSPEHSFSDEWSSNDETHWHPCTDEGYEDLKTSEAAHIPGEWVGTEEGHSKYCTVCNRLLEQENHTFGEEVVMVTPATYDEEGVGYKECSVCHYHQTVTFPKLDHHYSEAWEGNEGFHWHPCIDEGYEDYRSNVSSHNWVSDGFGHEVCSICGAYRYVYIDISVPEVKAGKPIKLTDIACSNTHPDKVRVDNIYLLDKTTSATLFELLDLSTHNSAPSYINNGDALEWRAEVQRVALPSGKTDYSWPLNVDENNNLKNVRIRVANADVSTDGWGHYVTQLDGWQNYGFGYKWSAGKLRGVDVNFIQAEGFSGRFKACNSESTLVDKEFTLSSEDVVVEYGVTNPTITLKGNYLNHEHKYITDYLFNWYDPSRGDIAEVCLYYDGELAFYFVANGEELQPLNGKTAVTMSAYGMSDLVKNGQWAVLQNEIDYGKLSFKVTVSI